MSFIERFRDMKLCRVTGGVAALGLAGLLAGCGDDRPEVIVYTSQDQVYSEPILRAFSEQHGSRARVVYDSEAVKTVGLANRLLAERSHPRCDLFWNNEELRTRQLAAQGVFPRTNGWETFGYRTRRLVINTNLVDERTVRWRDLTNEVWRGKVAMAYPLFGTTATHFLALRTHWGKREWRQWCQALSDNDPFLVDGNSVVVRLVGRGEAWIGMTDWDDIQAGRREGLPVRALPLDPDSIVIPNTAAITQNAPHPKAAQVLLNYLTSSEVVGRLVEVGALEGTDGEELRDRTVQPDWETLLADMEEATRILKELFLR